MRRQPSIGAIWFAATWGLASIFLAALGLTGIFPALLGSGAALAVLAIVRGPATGPSPRQLTGPVSRRLF